MARVGVIGLGSVGSSVMHGMSLYHESYGYDIIGDYEINEFLNSEVVFVCVPTPGGVDGRLDCSAVDAVLDLLSIHKYMGIVVIKSTIRVGYMEYANSRHPDLKLVYMPEFLREKSRFTWFLKPDRLVISGKEKEVNKVLSLFYWAKDAKVIRTDYRSAEVGKLAHNAYIATKVSFTNQMELISNELGANSDSVLEIVSSDRRVISNEHLKPGLGPYRGKCVPKDTEELINAASNAKLLKSVRFIKESFPAFDGVEQTSNILVIIPTKNRPNKLKRALESISEQVRKPSKVIVISDCSSLEEIRSTEIVENLKNSLPLEYIRNSHVKNLSGALNTGIEYFISTGGDPERTFLAILDDDDWWERTYLSNVSDFAMETDSDWIVSGIVRHDEKSGQKIRQTIPERISISDFLVGNPNIQGSNLFVRLSKIIEAGMFDETLPSTTDRDICIRLLRLSGIRYEVLMNHLTHHDASLDNTRLSTPFSNVKKAGLEAFYRKYQSIMTGEQMELFKERAQKLFGIFIERNKT